MYDLNKILRLSHLRSGLIQLAGVVVSALEEINTVKADKPVAVSATVPVTGWQKDSGVYPYYYDITADGVTAADIAVVTVVPSGISAAVDCGLCPSNETLMNTVRLRAHEIPSQAIALEYELMKGSEE